MGRFIYDSTTTVDFDDRLLAHLQTVINLKLRRGESFPFTWRNDRAIGDGQTSVWLHPRCNLAFKFYGGRQVALNRSWIEVLMLSANTTVGLQLVPEPTDRATPRDAGVSS